MSSKLRILIVDDSVVFRSQIRAALERSPEFEVVGVANNGKIAIQKLEQSSVDVVIMDMEMPEMDGPTAIKEIRSRKFPVKILVFSSSTKKGSEEALKALFLGADDILCKPQSDSTTVGLPIDLLFKDLTPKVMQFSLKDSTEPLSSSKTQGSVEPQKKHVFKVSIETFHPRIVLIGSSTGGPIALEKIFKDLRGPLKIPILIVQHMPPVFTAALAKRIQDQTGIPAAEAKHMELLENKIYIAPGDFHMNLEVINEKVNLTLNKNPQRNSVRPAVDNTFEAAAKIYGSKCLGIILTGMGEDGMLGCRAIKSAMGGVVIQEKESCTVFGMPGAVFTNSLQDEIYSLEKIASTLKRVST